MIKNVVNGLMIVVISMFAFGIISCSETSSETDSIDTTDDTAYTTIEGTVTTDTSSGRLLIKTDDCDTTAMRKEDSTLEGAEVTFEDAITDTTLEPIETVEVDENHCFSALFETADLEDIDYLSTVVDSDEYSISSLMGLGDLCNEDLTECSGIENTPETTMHHRLVDDALSSDTGVEHLEDDHMSYVIELVEGLRDIDHSIDHLASVISSDDTEVDMALTNAYVSMSTEHSDILDAISGMAELSDSIAADPDYSFEDTNDNSIPDDHEVDGACFIDEVGEETCLDVDEDTTDSVDDGVYAITFDIDGVDECGFVSVTGEFDSWSGWGAHTDSDPDMTVELADGTYEYVALCVDTSITDWYNDIWSASTILRPTEDSCDGDSDDGNSNFSVTVAGADETIYQCSDSCEEVCSEAVADDDDSTTLYAITFDIDGVDECGFVSVTGEFDSWSGWGAHTDSEPTMTVSLADGTYEYVALCVDTSITEWYNDIWSASTILRPTEDSCDGDSDDGNLNFSVTVAGADETINQCSDSCEEVCSEDSTDISDSSDIYIDDELLTLDDDAWRYYFTNSTNAVIADEDIYIGIVGKNWGETSYCQVVIDINTNIGSCETLSSSSMVPEPIDDLFYSLADLKMVDLPAIQSVRIFISIDQALEIQQVLAADGTTGFVAPNLSNPDDPNIDIIFDFFELTTGADGVDNSETYSPFWGNTTQVDAFSIPIVATLYARDGSYIKRGIDTDKYSRSTIFSDFESLAPSNFLAAFDDLIDDELRIHNASKSDRLSETDSLASHYFDDVIDALYASSDSFDVDVTDWGTCTGEVIDSVLTFNCDNSSQIGRIAKPTTEEVLLCSGELGKAGTYTDELDGVMQAQVCAAIQRGVALDSENWNKPSEYYSIEPYNYYAKYWHGISLDEKAYGFAYDDINDQSTLMYLETARVLHIDIYW